MLSDEIAAGREAYAILLNTRVIGALVIDSNIGEINHLYLDPDFQGAGFGRDAVDFALSRLAAHQQIILTVLTNNARAQALYAASGFRLTDRVTVLNERTGLSEVVMVRERQNDEGDDEGNDEGRTFS